MWIRLAEREVYLFRTETGGTSDIINSSDQQQQHQPSEADVSSAAPSTPTPPGDDDERPQAAHNNNNDDYDTEATESELALSEPAGSPSPPVHDEFSEHRTAGE